jgi:hypothetical protein
MMLDATDPNRALIGSQSTRRFSANRGKMRLRAQPVARERRHLQRMPRLAHDPRPRIARHRQQVDVAWRCARRLHHIPQSLGWKAGRVFDAGEALLFGGRHQRSVYNRGGASVSVIGVDSDD